MPEAVILRAYGDASQLKLEDVGVGYPQAGEIGLRQTAIGVNFHDIYVRTGLYSTLALPGIPGVEAAGIVEEVGAGVPGIKVGDRIAYVTRGYGAYASHRVLPASAAVTIPDDISDEVAASTMVRGLTVRMLTESVAKPERDEVILVHAAAGGVGRRLVRRATDLGVKVIGTVSTEEKASTARADGCADVILYRDEDFCSRVLDLTAGMGVDIVYDSIGKDTFDRSLQCLKACGHLVVFGQSSGPIEPVEISRLAEKSATISRPILFDYIERSGALPQMSKGWFEDLRKEAAAMTTPLPLSHASDAHRLLESRAAHDPIILVP